MPKYSDLAANGFILERDNVVGTEMVAVNKAGQSLVGALGDLVNGVNNLVIDVVEHYDCDPTGTNSNDEPFADLEAYIYDLWAHGKRLPRIVFQPGTYLYSDWPDLAFSFLEIHAIGNAVLRYTGTDDAVSFSARQTRGHQFIGFEIDAPKSAKNGLVFNSYHNGKVKARVRGAGTNYAGIYTKYCVLSQFELTCSINERSAWYNDGSGAAKPKYGLYVDNDDVTAGLRTQACTFINPVMEGPEIGIYVDYGAYNVFEGGSSEGCTDWGIKTGANSLGNRWHKHALEANTTGDIDDLGTQNEWVSCYASKLTRFGASSVRPVVDCGVHNQITMLAGCSGAVLRDADYNWQNTGGVTDGGTNTQIRNLRNYISGAYLTHFGRGTYTPTVLAIANLDAVTAYVTNYDRNEKAAHVWGWFTADPTTNGALTDMSMTLPIASDITSALQLAGTFWATDGTAGGVIYGDTTDIAIFRWIAVGTAAKNFGFHFSYPIV